MSNKREWLIQIRNIKGMSTTDIAEQSGITQQMYNYIENNKRNPSVELAQKIANVLDFDWTLFYPQKQRKNKKQET